MTFFLISGPPRKSPEPKIPGLIEAACKKQEVAFHLLDIRTTDPFNLPSVTTGDMVYRSVMSKKARLIEKLLVTSTAGHVYLDSFSALSTRGGSYFHHRNSDLPLVPTFPFLPESNKELRDAVGQLGGFPLIVKVTGGTLGVGVIRVDTFSGLISLTDYLRGTGVDAYLRQYIEHEYYVRVVVVGDHVVASHQTYALSGEFRTNVGDSTLQRREAYELPDELKQRAVEAVSSLHLEFAGVDILFDQHGTPFITEVNSPFDFVCTQEVTGIDIAEKLVSHLLAKTKG
ncbi:MAG: hypothetical protein WDZ93_03300 [Candidatus Paceibacterota bacterium]